MNRRGFAITLIVLALGMSGVPRAQKPPAAPTGPVVVLETQKGTIEIELFQADAPKSVAHFLALVRNGFYRGLRFHWVQAGVIQVGDPTSRDMSRMDSWGNSGSGRSVGVAEISKRKFEKGIVGLAYRDGQKPTAADSQFFILRAPKSALDGKYCSIGRVIAGMNVVEKIQKPDMLKNAYVKGDPAR
jgi:cyclophilin family peptidyl-prolyl cis-trans isomerase